MNWNVNCWDCRRASSAATSDQNAHTVPSFIVTLWPRSRLRIHFGINCLSLLHVCLLTDHCHLCSAPGLPTSKCPGGCKYRLRAYSGAQLHYRFGAFRFESTIWSAETVPWPTKGIASFSAQLAHRRRNWALDYHFSWGLLSWFVSFIGGRRSQLIFDFVFWTCSTRPLALISSQVNYKLIFKKYKLTSLICIIFQIFINSKSNTIE